MRPLSDTARAVLGGSHSIRTRLVGLGFNGRTEALPSSSVIFDVLDGYVVESLTAQVRSRLDVTVAWSWPADVEPYRGSAETEPNEDGWYLSPLGKEVHVARLLLLPDGTEEALSIGYYRVDDVEEIDRGVVRIVGSDRSSWVIDQPRLDPISYASSNTVASIFDTLADRQQVNGPAGTDIPGTTVFADASVGTALLGATFTVERDRWAAIQQLAASRGQAAWVDYLGRLYVAPPPEATVSPVPVWTVTGGDGGNLSTLRRSIGRADVVNRVHVTGDEMVTDAGSLRQVRGTALDTTSPTRSTGLFGVVTRWFHSPILTTDSACAAAAVTLLNRWRGAAISATAEIVPCPALEPGDAITVDAVDGTPATVYVVQETRIPLAPGTMRLMLRAAL